MNNNLIVFREKTVRCQLFTWHDLRRRSSASHWEWSRRRAMC